MRYSIFFIVVIISCSNISYGQQNSELSNFAPTVYPDRIMMTIPGNPATSRAISWRTVFNDTISVGEIALADANSKLEEQSVKIAGTFAAWEEGSQSSMGHKVVFENLQPDTKYNYRVGNGEYWSEWFQFETSSDSAEKFSFLYFGDVQNDIKSYGSRTLRQAYSHFSDADFMLFAGDLVSISDDRYWSEFFYAGGWIFGMVPSIVTPGNHEYDSHENRSRTFGKHWNQIYTMPNNSPSEKYYNRFYYVDYQGVRFVSIDSPAIETYVEDSTMLLNWLEKTFADNPNRWTVVLTHFPVYSCSQGRSNEKYKNTIKPLLEKHGVDLVLQGHDHSYCRGQNLDKVGPNCKNAPMYIVSMAGPKMYGLDVSFWSDRVASKTQLYQHITISNDTLHFKSFMVTGELYDDFMLVKNKNGVNHFIESEEVANILQRSEMPKGARRKYTEQDLQKYRQKFQDK